MEVDLDCPGLKLFLKWCHYSKNKALFMFKIEGYYEGEN